jgi:hypothetical protein
LLSHSRVDSLQRLRGYTYTCRLRDGTLHLVSRLAASLTTSRSHGAELSLAAWPSPWFVRARRARVAAHGGAPATRHPPDSTLRLKPSTPSTRWARQRGTAAAAIGRTVAEATGAPRLQGRVSFCSGLVFISTHLYPSYCCSWFHLPAARC